MTHSDFEYLVVRHRHRVPVPTAARAEVATAEATRAGAARQGAAAARQFDAALMSAGFKASAELLERLSGLDEATVVGIGARTLATVREMVGDHVAHNAYFVDFPANVPDTLDFWMGCIADALADTSSRTGTLAQPVTGVIDLLTLPSYGSYRHTYEEMLLAHDELIHAAGDRMTVLHSGGDPDDEVVALYLALAGSTTPLGEEALFDLELLAEACAAGPQPDVIPVRENRAVVNRARLTSGMGPLVDTVTDVLRLACALSDGDVTLVESTRFRSVPRPMRRGLLAALDAVVAASPAKLADVRVHREAFKRLGERLHPHEYPQWPHAAQVFAVARGESVVPSVDSRVDTLLAAEDVAGAALLLASAAPGKLFRSLDRLLRAARTEQVRDMVMTAAVEAAPQVSGRVLLSVREHFLNRRVVGPDSAPGDQPRDQSRVFVNRLGGAWVTPERRAPVSAAHRDRVVAAVDAEIRGRLPDPGHLVLGPDVLDVALPLSGKASAAGLGVLPRGSVSRIRGDLLRFFVYWKQTRHTTDFDLSALMLDVDYRTVSWLSYTALSSVDGEHSGDIVDAPEGASEFINLRLGTVRGGFIVPQVNIYAGEGFEEVAESFFGFMLREDEQRGQPFEPRTVRMKSELRGQGRVALPLVFLRGKDGKWRAKWLHLYLRGKPAANRVEDNRVTVATLVRGIVERDQSTVRYLTDLLAERAEAVTRWDGGPLPQGPVTFIGLERPEGLHPESRVVTTENLRDLIPA
ncbi:hypothetical protein ACWGR4_45975 [Embleya sp. NPDC055664]